MIYSRAIRGFDPTPASTCSIAAAVLGAGVLGAGATAWGASKAADAQTKASQAAIANTNQIYNSNKELLQPFVTGGTNALSTLTDFTNPNGNGTGANTTLATLQKLLMPGADQSATLSQTPGYQFAQSQGNRQILNALAARGLGGAPGAITQDIGQFSSGLANQTYGTTLQNLLSLFGSNANALQGIVSTGANAGGAVAGAGTAATSAINSAITGAGNAQAASANATGGAIAGLGGNLTTAALLQKLTGGNNNSSIYPSSPDGYNGNQLGQLY